MSSLPHSDKQGGALQPEIRSSICLSAQQPPSHSVEHTCFSPPEHQRVVAMQQLKKFEGVPSSVTSAPVQLETNCTFWPPVAVSLVCSQRRSDKK